MRVNAQACVLRVCNSSDWRQREGLPVPASYVMWPVHLVMFRLLPMDALITLCNYYDH